MKQKIMIAAGSQCFEFDGEITEVNEEFIILQAKHGEIFIERKYVVFIQYLNEEPTPAPAQPSDYPQPRKTDAAAKFISKRLKHDPVNEIMEEMVPPSQLPDGESPEAFRYRFNPREQMDPVYGNASAFINDDDVEVMRNVASNKHMWRDTPVANAADLQEAVKVAMENEEHDFSMGMGGGKYKNPAQTVLGMKNANSKKDRSR